MAAWALGLCLAYLAIVFGVRAAVLLRRTGSSGWVSIERRDRTQRSVDLLVVTAFAFDLLVPTLVLSGALGTVVALDGVTLHATGFAVLCAGLALAVAAQRDMGVAWSTGVDPETRSPLVTGGLFSLVRHPVYTSMIASSLGIALLVPTILAPAALALCIAAVELQARLVEEPHLLTVHGRPYAAYAARVGRFLPGIGRIPKSS